MGKATGFLEYEREKPQERDPLNRLGDWKEYSARFTDAELNRQGARCMDCGTPFCHMGMELEGATTGCPIHNLIPEWNDLVYRGRWKEALERLLETNNFPEFTGRVCPAPCEGSCTLAISEPAVAIKSIERSIIDKGFENGWITPRMPGRRTGKRIAVIGSGPAGLAAADQLNQAGHHVTVFERADQPGGLLMYGIPNMKLEKSIVQRRVKLLEAEGIVFITNTEVGKDISAEAIKRQFDTVLVCTGFQRQRQLQVPGKDADGVHLAMDYLTEATKRVLKGQEREQWEIDASGKDVIVIGGGDTGADCVATALRQKCNSVVQFGKHPVLPATRSDYNLWPAYPNVFTVDYAYEEAAAGQGEDPRQYLIQTKKIVADDQGRVKELHTIQMEKQVDGEGNAIFKEIPGTEKIWPAQLVLVTIGFEGTDRSVAEQFGIAFRGNRIKADYGIYQTNVNGVFAAGDARRGQSLIVWAINEGREAAREIDEYLMGTTLLP